MKIITPFLVLSILLPLSAAAGSPTAFGEVPVPEIPARVSANGDRVTSGTARVYVALRLGQPSRVLADGSWLYSHYVMRTGDDDGGKPAALVVRFTANQVERLTLVDLATEAALRESKPARLAAQAKSTQ